MADGINNLLLAELIVVVIVTSAFLFYWNRLLGSVFGFLLRLYTWRRLRAYISIGSLQISPLAGRIAWKDLEYHSSNLSFRSLNGHVTWRYWILRVRQEADTQSTNTKRKQLPCRIKVFSEGVEGFVYNRTPAYETIIERMRKHEQEKDISEGHKAGDGSPAQGEQTSFGARLRRTAKSAASQDTRSSVDRPSSDDSTAFKPVQVSEELPAPLTPIKTPVPPGVNWLREALPMELHIVTGSIVLGSDATPMVLIGDFKRADGTVEISDSRSICDLYKTTVDLHFEEPKLLMRTNVDYSGPILAHGRKVYEQLNKEDAAVTNQKPSLLSSFLQFHALSKRFSFLHDSKFSTPPVAGLPKDKIWRGLARYRMDDDEVKNAPRGEQREYAKVTTLLDAPLLDLTYYADTPGTVPTPSQAELIDETDEFGNVEPAPEYGFDINVHGGIIKYGPWADRQRDALQRNFAPSIFFDTMAKERLKPGDTRVHSHLLVNLQLSEETTLRIPTREASKDWIYDNAKVDLERRYGWIDVTVGANSAITYTQSQFATARGYDAILVIHMDSLGIASSVNLETFIRAKTCKVSLTMPTPLRWDARRDWGLDITLDGADITLLRDHIQLISDLAKDWSSGQVGDFQHFVPNHYNFRVTLLNYALHIYINDFNIVDEPKSRDSNAFMDVYGAHMEAYVAVAATQYRAELSTIPFSVQLSDAKVDLSLPNWDTHRSFGPAGATEIGKIGAISAKGSYTYYSTPHPEHQETLNLHLEGKQVVFIAFGWALRRLFCIKNNYFGSFTQFTTLQEYLERYDHDPNSVGDPVEEKYRPGRSDAFAVNVTMNVEESLILLSDEIHNCRRGLVMPVPQLQMALKSTEHFLELSLDAMPTFIVATKDMTNVYQLGSAPAVSGDESIFIEGLEVKANRLFGPQPRAETYLCLWEIVAPRMTAFLTPTFLQTIQSSVAAVVFNYQDIDNAPASIYEPKALPDVTCFKLGIDHISVVMDCGDAAVSADLPEGINLDTSSWATRNFASSVGIIAPSIDVALLERNQSTGRWASCGELSTSLSMDVYNAPTGWQAHANAQQEFLKKEDGPTRRLWYLYSDDAQSGPVSHVENVYLPKPKLVGTVDSDEEDDDSEESLSTGKKDDYASSPSSTDSESQSQSQPRRSRTSSMRRPQSTPMIRMPSRQISSNEESDSESQASFQSESSHAPSPIAPTPDMAAALFYKLGEFRKLRAQLPTQQRWEDPEEGTTGMSEPVRDTATFTNGKILRVCLGTVVANVSPGTIDQIGMIRSALSTTPSVEGIIDGLLIKQVDSVVDSGGTREMILLDLVTRDISLNAKTTSSDSAAAIQIALKGNHVNMTTSPREDGKTDTDLFVGMASATVEVFAEPKSVTGISLQDTSRFADCQDSLLARFGHVSVRNLRVSARKSDQGNRLHSTVLSVEGNSVPSIISVVSDIAHSWQPSIDRLGEMTPTPNSSAFLLYRIIEAAKQDGVTASYPTFMYESAYGLHVEDQRNIRRDAGWMMLARLRHWLNHVNLNIALYRPSDDTLRKLVVAELAKQDESFEGQEDWVLQQAFVQHVFGTKSKEGEAEEKGPSGKNYILLSIIALSMLYWDRSPLSQLPGASLVRLQTLTVGLHSEQASTGGKRTTTHQVMVALRNFDVDVNDCLVPSIQRILDVIDERQPQVKIPPPPRSAPAESKSQTAIVLDVHLLDTNLSVTASGLRSRLGIQSVHSTLSQKLGSSRAESATTNSQARQLTFSAGSTELLLSQLSDTAPDTKNPSERLMLAVRLSELRLLLDCHIAKDGKNLTSNVLLAIGHLDLDSKPQLRAFLAFAKDWKTQRYGEIRPLVHRLDSLMSKSADTSVDTGPPSQVILDLSFGSADLKVRAAKAVWVRWEIGKIYITGKGVGRDLKFGIRASPQVIGAYSTVKKVKSRDTSTVKLPSLTVLGSTGSEGEQLRVSATISLGFFVGVLKPALLDRLLSLYQRLGADIAEITKEYKSTVQSELRIRQSSTSLHAEHYIDEPTPAKKKSKPVLLDLRLSVSGVRFGLQADDVATTLLFEAISLNGQVSNTSTEQAALMWRAKVDHFGLSLGHLGTAGITDNIEPIRKHRSAYMILDVEVQEIPRHGTSSAQLSVYLNRVHTVMHVAALSELSDLIRSWQNDIHSLRDERGSEVAEVKTATAKLFKSLDSTEKLDQPEESWFASRLFTVEVVGFGMAIPLVESATIDLKAREQSVNPALLFSVRLISFHNRRNETARFKIQQMALQFLDKFDQGAAEHFTGEYHPSVNCMRLPSLDTQAQMSSKPDTWTLSAHCSADDFKLSLAPDVIDGVFKLIELYEQGKERLVDLEAHYRSEMLKREASEAAQSAYDGPQSATSSRQEQRIIVRMSYTFNSGKVELHRTIKRQAGTTPTESDPRARTGRAVWHDTFTLPAISVWLDYTGAHHSFTNGEEVEESSTLIFNTAVHESKNTLRPSILPFCVDIVNRIEKRSRETAQLVAQVAEKQADMLEKTNEATIVESVNTTHTKVRFTIRIDRSELRLSCAPDSNAYVDLKWESGGFMTSTTLGTQGMSTVVGSVSGVTASLSHEFAERGRSCIEAGAKDMALSITLHPQQTAREGKGLSIVLDTQLVGQFRLDAFSAWLIFRSVWIDNAPKLDTPLRNAIPEAAEHTKEHSKEATNQSTKSAREEPGSKLAVAGLFRFRAIDFDADIAISQTKLSITPVILRTISNGEQTEVDLKIGCTKVYAEGDVSGELCSEGIVFNTVRQSSRAQNKAHSTVLAMSINADVLSGKLFLGEMNILRFNLDPAVVTLSDDWNVEAARGGESQILLSFAVKAGQLQAVLRLLAIPRLLGNLYSVLDMVDTQRRIASQRSEIFKTQVARKLTQPSQVAVAILQTARRTGTAIAGNPHPTLRTAQRMRFDLAGIDIGIFNEEYEGVSSTSVADFYRFVIGRVEADLKRQTSRESLPMRDLALLISMVRWDTCDGRKAGNKESPDMSASDLIDKAWRQGHVAVASLPSMTLNMSSSEFPEPPVLDFDFELIWGETDGDIGVMPNFFDQAIQAFRRLLSGLDEQQEARARRIDTTFTRPANNATPDAAAKPDTSDPTTTLQYRPRDPEWANAAPIPHLKPLGKSTGEAARYIPKFKTMAKELPALSHRFVTLPLEDGMDLLLKIYEKQLPGH